MVMESIKIKPMAQPRPRATTIGRRIHMYDPPNIKAYKNAIALQMQRYHGVFPTGVPLVCRFTFQFARKRGWKPVVKPDVDNLSKAVMDAITMAGVWSDDAQVVSLMANKERGNEDMVLIHITEGYTGDCNEKT